VVNINYDSRDSVDKVMAVTGLAYEEIENLRSK
jgi:hypothetical protein